MYNIRVQYVFCKHITAVNKIYYDATSLYSHIYGRNQINKVLELWLAILIEESLSYWYISYPLVIFDSIFFSLWNNIMDVLYYPTYKTSRYYIFISKTQNSTSKTSLDTRKCKLTNCLIY